MPPISIVSPIRTRVESWLHERLKVCQNAPTPLQKKGMTIQQAPKQETKWSWRLFFFSTPYPFNWNTLIFSNICYHSPFSCATSTSPTAKAPLKLRGSRLISRPLVQDRTRGTEKLMPRTDFISRMTGVKFCYTSYYMLVYTIFFEN